MKIDTITTTVLTASDGHYLTDGDVYGKTIYLGQGRKPEEFIEITDAEYEESIKEADADGSNAGEN